MRLRRTTNNENSGANGRPTAAYDQIFWVALQGVSPFALNLLPESPKSLPLSRAQESRGRWVQRTVTLQTQTALGISDAELDERRERLLHHVRRQNLTGYVLFDQDYIQYFTRFSFLATERPVAFLQNTAGEMAILVPEFEAERTHEETSFERIETYREYPGTEHPMLVLGRAAADMGVRGAVGADQDGYPGILGYQGPALSEVIGASVVSLPSFIEGMMARKSEAEISLIRESAKWCNLAQLLLQRYTRPGITESEVSLRVEGEATKTMLDTLGALYGGQLGSSDGVSAGYRGQVGRGSAWAHAIAHNIEFRAGYVLVSETSAPIWGYKAELERAMVIGSPSSEQRRLFDHMAAAQQVAFEAIRPGRTCAEVDQAVLGYFEANDLMPLWRQHTGHAIGLRNHEAPFLDAGDDTRIEPGMVFTVEPGVYASEVGGFRHSDTVVVREDGIEILTFYPRDLDSLTITA
jgi:Xaa-Pro aminopeptidase